MGSGNLVVVILLFMGLMLAMTFSTRRSQRKQLKERENAMVIGNSVVTTSGFFGRIVDIDGDAVTLESPSGDESVWLRGAILKPMALPIAELAEDDASELASEEVSDTESSVADVIQEDNEISSNPTTPDAE